MHEMQTTVSDDRGVCLSVCLSHSVQPFEAARAVCTGSFGAAFAKLLWLLVMLVYGRLKDAGLTKINN